LAGWLETDFVCDRQGRRFVPHWHQHQRVRVDFRQLEAWYRTLDQLVAAKEQPSGVDGLRVIIVNCHERRQYEHAMRLRAMQRTEQALQKLQQRVTAGKLKTAGKNWGRR